MRRKKQLPAEKSESDPAAASGLPFPESGLSPALQRTIQAKIERGELDEMDHNVFEQNLRKIVRKSDSV